MVFTIVLREPCWKNFSLLSSYFPPISLFTSFKFTCTLGNIPLLLILRALSCFKAQLMEFLGSGYLYTLSCEPNFFFFLLAGNDFQVASYCF